MKPNEIDAIQFCLKRLNNEIEGKKRLTYYKRNVKNRLAQKHAEELEEEIKQLSSHKEGLESILTRYEEI